MDYKELLERAHSQLPSDISEHKRFEVPQPRSFINGMRTILANFKEICDALNRDPRHVLKFFSKKWPPQQPCSETEQSFKENSTLILLNA